MTPLSSGLLLLAFGLIVRAFGWREAGGRVADGVQEVIGSAANGFSDSRLELGEGGEGGTNDEALEDTRAHTIDVNPGLSQIRRRYTRPAARKVRENQN